MSETDLPEHVLDALGEGVYFLDLDRRIRLWNQGATAIAGYAAEQVIGQACSDGLLNHVDEEGRVLCGANCPLLATMLDGQERRARMYLHHQEGHLVPIVVDARPVRDATGRVIGAVESFRDDTDHTAIARRVEELEALAMLDPLTGTGNRRYMDAVLAQRLEDHKRTGTPFAILLLDVDRFKAVNDTHGHDTGDQVLRAIAGLLISAVRHDESVTRFGGEEFLIVTGPASRDELTVLGRRLTRLVRQIRHRVGDTQVTVTASIGATTVRQGDTLEAMLRRADQALLESKRTGRDRSTVE